MWTFLKKVSNGMACTSSKPIATNLFTSFAIKTPMEEAGLFFKNVSTDLRISTETGLITKMDLEILHKNFGWEMTESTD